MNISLEYLAGFIDGEGSIVVHRIKRKSRKIEYHKHYDFYYSLRLRVCNTNKKVIDKIVEQFGGRLYIQKHQDGIRKTAYHLDWHGNQAKELIEKIMPFLIIKQDQAEIASIFPCKLDGEYKVFPIENKIQTDLYELMKKLNK